MTLLIRTDAEHGEPIHWPPEAKSKITGKKFMLGIIGRRRRREQQRARWLQSISHWKVMSLSKLWEIRRAGEPRVLAVHGVTKSQT